MPSRGGRGSCWEWSESLTVWEKCVKGRETRSNQRVVNSVETIRLCHSSRGRLIWQTFFIGVPVATGDVYVCVMVYVSVFLYLYVVVLVFVYLCMYACVCVCVCVCVHVCVYV